MFNSFFASYTTLYSACDTNDNRSVHENVVVEAAECIAIRRLHATELQATMPTIPARTEISSITRAFNS